MSPNIYEFSSSVKFLEAVLAERKKQNPRYSIRAWAKAIGFRNPGFLSEILRGRRKLKPTTASRISSSLHLRAEEHQYFDLLVLIESAKTERERKLYSDLAARLKPGEGCFHLDLDVFRYVADWYHLALVEMTELKDFRYDPEQIGARFERSLSATQVEAAIARLLRLNLLGVDQNGKLGRRRGHPHIGDNIPSGAIRRHHRQMMELAQAALLKQPLTDRDIRGTTLCVDRKGYDEAVKALRECHRRIQKLEKAGSGDEVYQFNTQFFRLTRRASA